MAEHGTLSPDCSAHYAIARKAVKGEDRHLVVSEHGSYSLVAVFDGHGGKQAAETCTKEFPGALSAAVGALIGGGHAGEATDHSALAAALPRALVAAFSEVDARVRASCASSGCTSTVVVCGPGRLITVAACGDSLAVLDTLTSVQKLSPEHRAQTHAGERARVLAAGAQVAPAEEGGTLRVWPGGLAVSRSIGDAPAKPAVCAHPEVSQCYVPLGTGARLVVASDGLWDVVPSAKAACSSVRKLSATAAANALVRQAGSVPKGEQDDVTVCVVDFLAHSGDKGPFQSLGAGHEAAAAGKVAVKWPISGMSDAPHAGYTPPSTVDEPVWTGAAPPPVAPAEPSQTAYAAHDFGGDWLAPAGLDGAGGADDMDWVAVPTHKRRAHQHTHSADGSVKQRPEHGAAATPAPMAVDAPQLAATEPNAVAATATAPQSRPARKALPKPRQPAVAKPAPEAPAAAAAPAGVPPQVPRRKAESQRKSARDARPVMGKSAPPAAVVMAPETAAVAQSQPHLEQPLPLPQQQQRMAIPKPRVQNIATSATSNSALVPRTPAQAAPPPLVLPPPLSASWQPAQTFAPPIVIAGAPFPVPGMPALRFGSFGAPPKVYQLQDLERELTAPHRAQ